jgi:hypothetical protein
VGIVSPQWVLHSLRSGRQQRCLTVSADASRHLPAAAAVEGSPLAPSQPSVATAQGGISGALLASREARQRVLSQLAAGGSPGVAAAAALGPPRQPGATPSLLLSGLLWSVLDPPSAARLEQLTTHAQGADP